MEAELQALVSQAEAGQDTVSTWPALAEFKATFVGPNGSLTAASKEIGKLPNEQKPVFGKKVNETKQRLEVVFDSIRERIENAELAAKLGPQVDPSLSVSENQQGTEHPLTQVREKIIGIFRKIGFTLVEGPELETEFFCFDALNTPASHPARDMQDTYFLPADFVLKGGGKRGSENFIMRPHTSAVQIRTMTKRKPPVRILSPGRCFRRDTVDATHSANFHQVEGLYVDENVTIRDLKALLDHFVKELFGSDAKTRFRPSFFPFTEPSFEMDVQTSNLRKLSGKWIEIMGCGMVDPNVFSHVGYDADQVSGYAFGMGVERIAMILHGIDDIRHFYQNDLRFLKQFQFA
ncbi:MAG: phenylalanine--tRNA ligase subunit alpha [Opitutae bacterium]|nr:phenylalanine--tRNA ligase subunit alpha [Opitutae bacterium]MBT4223382.1 phenylalanine--tRNA ligase subunit alpha [Opitutae bacterium]MBT5379843.1 phenylalanine--tRNA ligase subunit alpha [Opitutae bacterium]MBT6463397.1 phenylalanine--tRNA ligase subunit alpha [Opitutae bacterium]MBT6957333.1 phenylalanine--tRNA ligase subunit alpha [Opitutae bacterium]